MPGAYIVSALSKSKTARYAGTTRVVASAAGSADVSIHLEPVFSIHGRLRFESKSGGTSPGIRPTINLRPAVTTLTGDRMVWNWAQGDSFTIDGLTSGSYRIDWPGPRGFYLKAALIGGRNLARESGQLAPGAGPLELVLSDDGATIEGDVVDAEGKPIAGGVTLLGERQPIVVTAEATGQFSAPNLPPGEYTAYAWASLENVEYANPAWLRSYAGVRVRVGPEGKESIRLKAETVDSVLAPR